MALDNTIILNELKVRNSIPPADEAKVNSYITQMKSKAMTYCNLEELPDALFFTIVEMVEQRMGIGMVSSVSRGDTSIKYNSADEIVSGFRHELNKFRRLKT